MSTTNSRSLKFICNELGRGLSLYLTFVAPKTGDVASTPITWKVVEFQPTGQGLALVKYTGVTAFVVPAGEEGNRIIASNSQVCAPGQRCTLVSALDGSDAVTKATTGDPNFVRCANNTSSIADIGFGTTEADGTDVELIYFWKNVPVSSFVKFEFSPVLEIFYTTDFLSNPDPSSPPPESLWRQNLNSLASQTTLWVAIDPTTQVPTVTTLQQSLLPGALYATKFDT